MYHEQKVITVIPARGGSKGIPRKNLQTLDGRPLISHTIEAAMASRYIDSVYVSTDDPEIAEVSRGIGAEVPGLRPMELSRDDAPSIGAIHHILGVIRERGEGEPGVVVFAQPTSPFRTTAHLDAGIELLSDHDAVMGVKEVTEHPFFMYCEDCTGGPNDGGEDMDGVMAPTITPYVKMDVRPLRRQDLPLLYSVNASMHICWGSYHLTSGPEDPVVPMFTGRIAGLVMDATSSLDINEPVDLEVARAMVEMWKREGGPR